MATSMPQAHAKEAISLDVSASKVSVGQTVTIYGFVEPIQRGIKVSISFTKPDGTSFMREVTTACSGAYSYTLEPDMGGIWTVKSSWEKASSQPATFSVAKMGPPNLLVKVPDALVLGKEVKIYAILTDKNGAPIEGARLQFQIGSTDQSVLTDSSGQATIRFVPPEAGSLSVKVVFLGDARYEGTTASATSAVRGDDGQMNLVAVAAIVAIAMTSAYVLMARRKK